VIVFVQSSAHSDEIDVYCRRYLAILLSEGLTGGSFDESELEA